MMKISYSSPSQTSAGTVFIGKLSPIVTETFNMTKASLTLAETRSCDVRVEVMYAAGLQLPPFRSGARQDGTVLHV